MEAVLARETARLSPEEAAAIRSQAGGRIAMARSRWFRFVLDQHAQTGSPLEYAQIEETVSPEVLQLVGDWALSPTTRR